MEKFNDIPEFKELSELKNLVDTLNNTFGENILGEQNENDLNSILDGLNDLDDINTPSKVKFTNNSINEDPTYQKEGDSGFDLRANISHPITIKPLERYLIPTGLSFELPPNTELQVRSRSGLSLKHGICVLNSPGTVDQGYRGEVGVILVNLSNDTYTVQEGERIAQGVISSVLNKNIITLEKVDSLTESERGSDGFGSTGKK
tara:strand:- start:180 stop:791 length:612 start_codon:yes stop_codon:yes gene_type:complete